jgi:hypothetical protein
MRRFVMIMRNVEPAPSGDELGEVISELFDWLKELREKNIFETGDFLVDDGGKLVTKASAGSEVSVTDLNMGSGQRVKGFYFFRANDSTEILELCRRCPVLGYGWQIEVREVDLAQ